MYNKTIRVGDGVRIISGKARGRILKPPAGRLTRPTLDRTRESLFNILTATSLHDTHVLDIFAGTGALGLEALSRGAKQGVFIDHHTVDLIRENGKRCGFLEQMEILPYDVHRALKQLQGRQFHFIFADPPYNKRLVNDTISDIFHYHLLCPDGLILMEHSKEESIEVHPLYTVIREKSYGKDTRITFIRAYREGV